MALFVMAENMAGICAGQVLRTNDAPKYHNAFLALPVVSIFSLLVIACITVQNIWSNRKLEQKFPLANNQVSEENFTAETRKVENDNTVIIVRNIIDESHMEKLLSNIAATDQQNEKYLNST